MLLAILGIEWYVYIVIIILIVSLGLMIGFVVHRYRFSKPNKTVYSQQINSFDEIEDYEKLSKIGVESAHKFIFDENENGEEMIGIIYSPTSKVIFFKPCGNKANVGDVVTVEDLSGKIRAVPVVVENKKLDKSLLASKKNEIISVVYKK